MSAIVLKVVVMQKQITNDRYFYDFLPSLVVGAALAPPPVNRHPLSPFSLISPLMSCGLSQHLVSGNMTYLYHS